MRDGETTYNTCEMGYGYLPSIHVYIQSQQHQLFCYQWISDALCVGLIMGYFHLKYTISHCHQCIPFYLPPRNTLITPSLSTHILFIWLTYMSLLCDQSWSRVVTQTHGHQLQTGQTEQVGTSIHNEVMINCLDRGNCSFDPFEVCRKGWIRSPVRQD
jgi:hypothetical protein